MEGPNIGEQFYRQDHQDLAKLLMSWLPSIRETHRALWPGAVVPETDPPEPSRSRGKKKALTAPTTLAFASMLHMFRVQGRGPRLRLKVFELLKAIIEKACSRGLTLDILVMDVNGQANWTSQTSQDPKGFQFWTEAYRARHVSFQWGADVLDDTIPWMTSTSSRPHLAEFVAFCTDQPASLKTRANAELLDARKALERAALSIVTQVAVVMDRDMARFYGSLEVRAVAVQAAAT